MSFIITMVPLSCDTDIKKFTFCLLGTAVILSSNLHRGLRAAPMEQERHAHRVLLFFHYTCVSEIRPGGFLPSTPDMQPHHRIQMREPG